MNPKLPIYLAVIALLLSSHFVYGQLTLGTQVRPRAEFRNGFKTLTEDSRDAAFFVEQRSRLFATYKASSFQVKVNLQDVRIWGSTNQIYKNDPTMTNVYEAWGLYNYNPNWSFKIGRMDLDYDNARFLGDLDWAAQGRSHDAFLVKFRNDSSSFQVDIGGAFNQTGFEPAKLFETFYTGVNNYKTMQFIWLHKKFANAKFSALIHNDGRQVQADSTVSMRQTYAVLGSGTVGGLKVGGEFYYQGGENGLGTDVSAILLSAYATVKAGTTPLTLGFDYVSGTSREDTKDKSFNPLYGTNHKFYGYMDYFYVGNFHGQENRVTGLLDIHFKTRFKTGQKSSLVANTHVFSSPVDLHDPTDATQTESKYLGTEVDLVYNLTLDKNVKLNLGYSQMFAGESMELVKRTSGDHKALTNWVWFMINFNPTVFIGDK